MKRNLFILAIVAAVAGLTRAQGQPDLGPGEKGATLRLPGAEAPRPPNPAPAYRPSAVPGGAQIASGVTPFSPGLPGAPHKVAVLPSNDVSVNKDIEITEKQAPWLIYVMSYAGEDAPKLARDFVVELRNNFKLNAYVYNSGAEEKKREFERVQKARQEQIEALQKAGLKGDYVPTPIRAVRIDEQTAVLIDGGFRTRDEALAALKKLRAMKDRDFPKDFAKRVQLDVKVAIKEEQDNTAKSGVRVNEFEVVLLNPFARAFPARNPMSKNYDVPQMDATDARLLREINKDEPFTVLKTRKPFTLAIKQYNTEQIVARNQKEADGFLHRFRTGLTLKNGMWNDQAAQNAHDLAEAFRKSGLTETHVLHAKYCSYVTVGSYDSAEDQRLQVMQSFLESKLRDNAYRPLDLFPRPMLLAVPN
jgi:hypothetical protein